MVLLLVLSIWVLVFILVVAAARAAAIGDRGLQDRTPATAAASDAWAEALRGAESPSRIAS
jgi:hypothetical protein